MKLINRAIHFVVCAAILFTCANASAQKLKIVEPKVEYQSNPLGIETASPRLSWKLTSALKDTKQVSYELKVGTDQSKLASGKELVWKSNESTDQSVHIAYGGTALASNKRYYWQVRVKDNHGNTSPWSEVAFWHTGLKPGDWTAKWISVTGKDSLQASPSFRKELSLQKQVKQAIAYVTAKGLYEASINGQRVGDSYFAPGWTSYKNHMQYQVYDVTALLKKGDNVIAATLGSGWYKGRIGFGGQRNFYGDTRALLMQIDVTYSDGTKETVQTDGNWKVSSSGPILSSDIYDGETYDARLEKTGWDNVGYDDASWSVAQVLNDGYKELVGMTGPPVKKHEEIKAIKVIKTPKGETVIDFGQNLTGWVKLKARGAAGTKITVGHAEVLDKAGNFYTTNLRSAKQENAFILKGNGEEVFQPHFSFQGFRYIKLDGYPGEPKIEDFLAIAIYSDMAITGKFTTSNALLNQLQHNIQWGQKGNFLDVPTDCPQRDERLGWTGDAQAFYNTAAYNMDVAGFFTKWLKDVKADQLKNGSIPFVVPNVINEGSAGAAGWGDVATIIPWDMYVAYGDKQILVDQYESMKGWVNFISSKSQNNLWNTGFHFGDWLFYRPEDDTEGRAAVTDKYLIAQCFYAHSTQLLINSAEVLNKKEDVEKYSTLLKEIKAAFLKEYLTASGRMVSGTQTAYVLALNFDMLPENLREQAAQRLVENVRSYGNHLTTGFLGTPYLCHVLSRFGFTNVAYDLLMQESYPSWLYPVKMGATTIWERWDGIKTDGSFQTADMNSFNHYAYGAIGDWMYRTMAGISSAPSGAGYKKITIAPQPGANITSVSGQLETPYGLLSSSWKIENGVFKLDVIVPPNTTASVVLPSGLATGEKSKSNKIDNIKQIGSGSYHFEYPFK